MVEILVPLVIFLAMTALGARVAAAMGLAGLVGLILTAGFRPTLTIVEGAMFRQATSATLIAIPLFLLMAEFAQKSGIIHRLFDVAQYYLGNLRAGVAYATITANAAMAALSGSSVAATGLIAKIAVPEMERLGYDRKLAMGLAATSGTIAVMIPPSIGLILFGVITQTSIGALLLGGILPGLLTTVLYMVVVRIWARVRSGDVPLRPKDLRGDAAADLDVNNSTRESHLRIARRQAAEVIPFVLIVALVLGVIYTGVATVVEAAAIGALATFFAWCWVRLVLRTLSKPESSEEIVGPSSQNHTYVSKVYDAEVPTGHNTELTTDIDVGGTSPKVTPNNILDCARAAVSTTVMIMALVITAVLLGGWLTRSGVTRSAIGFVEALNWPAILILLLISIVLIFLGMFMSQIEILVLTLPLLFPLVVGVLDYHPIWFGIWMTKLLEIGLVTPPFGMNVFVATAALGTGYRVEDAFRGVIPFYSADGIVLACLLLFPQMVTWVDGVI